MPKLWVRNGDADNYNDFDDLDGVAEYLQGSSPLQRINEYGFVTKERRGNDYISFFWGDDEAQPTKIVSNKDVIKLNKLLKE